MKLTNTQLADIIKMVEEDKITPREGIDLINIIEIEGGNPTEVAKKRGIISSDP